jgi:Protein adenylyltransferase SelO
VTMMLCYVILCYVMSCYVVLCYAMLCYAMLCYVMSCRVTYSPPPLHFSCPTCFLSIASLFLLYTFCSSLSSIAMILAPINLRSLTPNRSDNTLLGGRTIDYGPFGWMEKYDPMYQVSGSCELSDGMTSVAYRPDSLLSSFLLLFNPFLPYLYLIL